MYNIGRQVIKQNKSLVGKILKQNHKLVGQYKSHVCPPNNALSFSNCQVYCVNPVGVLIYWYPQQLRRAST